MSAYWPWWAGALALGSIAVAHARLLRRPMGVSGSLAKLASPRRALEADRTAEAMLSDQAAFEAALLAATAAEFGDSPNRTTDAAAAAPPIEAQPGASFAGHVAFLAMMIVGAFGASLARGGVSASVSLGATHAHLFGTGAAMLAVLAGGGLLVGFGTRMSGGCTSGHGLSGCARFVPSSLVATATFMGAAIATSLLLGGVLR